MNLDGRIVVVTGANSGIGAKRGAKTSIHLATADGLEATNGAHYDESPRVKPGSQLSQDMALAARLRETSERWCG